jgi:hypothetical protein
MGRGLYITNINCVLGCAIMGRTLVQQSAVHEAFSGPSSGQQGCCFLTCPASWHGWPWSVIPMAGGDTGLAACAACIALPFKMKESTKMKASMAL